MKQYILSSFVSKRGGGNRAAVIFDDYGMSEDQMLEIAKNNNFSETAFINFSRINMNSYSIRYFTPEKEVDICGHGALASFHLLKHLGYLKGNNAYHCTKAGDLHVIMKEDTILLQMKMPELIMRLSKNIITDITNIKEDEIIANKDGMVDVISTGLKDIILEVKGIDVLKGMHVLRDRMIETCKKYDLVGMHVVSRETIEQDSDFCCRNFAPAVGIDEESATGTSNASLLYCNITYDKHFDYDKLYKIEQGYFMDSPSNIYVKADRITGSIYVGGIAKIEDIVEITI